MESILKHISRNQNLVFAVNNDNTFRKKAKLQRHHLIQLTKHKMISISVYETIRPTGSQRLRMYGLPNTDKKDVSLRPILSMIESAHYGPAKWLTTLLQPIPDFYYSHRTKDSITFAETMQQLNLGAKTIFLCSFDISSPFTNILSAEAIQI